MTRFRMILLIFIFCLTPYGATETVTESWLLQAGISCGGGLSIDLQGQIDAALIKRLKLASIKGDGEYQMTEVETLLTQFQKEEKQKIYTDYVHCLITLMNLASNTSQLPSSEVVLSSSVAVVAPLEVIKRGQRFAMVPGDSVAINNQSVIFSISDTKGIRMMSYAWSNSETGEENSGYFDQSELITISQSCSLVPYKVDEKNKQASFISHC